VVGCGHGSQSPVSWLNGGTGGGLWPWITVSSWLTSGTGGGLWPWITVSS